MEFTFFMCTLASHLFHHHYHHQRHYCVSVCVCAVIDRKIIDFFFHYIHTIRATLTPLYTYRWDRCSHFDCNVRIASLIVIFNWLTWWQFFFFFFFFFLLLFFNIASIVFLSHSTCPFGTIRLTFIVSLVIILLYYSSSFSSYPVQTNVYCVIQQRQRQVFTHRLNPNYRST